MHFRPGSSAPLTLLYWRLLPPFDCYNTGMQNAYYTLTVQEVQPVRLSGKVPGEDALLLGTWCGWTLVV